MYHKHHIIPKHMGGTNDDSNLILLTVEEHAEEHLKLFNAHKKIEDWYAYLALSGQISSDEARRSVCRERMLKNNPMHDKNIVEKAQKKRSSYKPSEETKKKISNSLLGKCKKNTENMNKDKIKTYLIITPTNEHLIVSHLRNFCLENNLTESLMYKVASGCRNHHKGYKCTKLS